MSKTTIREILKYVGIVAFFLVLAYGFVPQVLQGKVVNQSDTSGFMGMSHEMMEYNKANPSDRTTWTGSMFSGMPTTTIHIDNSADLTQGLYNLLLTGKRPATYLFITLLGAFLLMLSLGIDSILAIGGAVAVAFCSYNLQIIQVGHNTKMQAIAFLPWVLAALIFTYRSALKEGRTIKDALLRSGLGAVLFALALSFEVKANHQQITYYLAILIFIYAIALLIWVLCQKDKKALIGRFFIASGLLLVLGIAGIATNAGKLLPVYEYTPNSMRGGSSLLSEQTDGSKGLTLDYATAWSYGWEELPNLMIADFNGGSSAGAIKPSKSETYKLLKKYGQPDAAGTCKALPLYWGPQPFTAGPMYMGAITIFLFLLGLGLCRGRDKWWMLAGTIVAILLGVGSHFMPFTEFWYKYVPFYNKFRTVSMSIILLQFTLPMLGFLALNRICKEGVDMKVFYKKGGIAYGISAGFCLLMALIPSLAGSFTSAADAGQQDILVDALQADRRTLLVADAWRSFLLITAAAAIIWWALRPAAKGADPSRRRMIGAALVCVLVLVDLFPLDKRYLNSDHFVSKREFNNQFEQQNADKIILQDTDPSYRVLDLSASTFNDSRSSYWHKTIGGYSPAKLQKYQDLISYHIQPEIGKIAKATSSARTVAEFEEALPATPVLNALNARYIIVDQRAAPVVNKNALGNAWFVNKVTKAGSPKEEIALIGIVDLKQEIVAEGDALPQAGDGQGTIVLDSYAPNELNYTYSCAEDQIAVFSEVYYPNGWVAYLDTDRSKSVDIFCADWTLRAAKLPAGEHKLTMRFEPKSYSVGNNVARASSSLLLVLLIIGIALPAAQCIKQRKQQNNG